MQVPYRTPGKYTAAKKDYTITQQKYDELEAEHARLLERRPFMASEVSRLAENGDFSENAEYQLAKGKLRGLNNRLMKIAHDLRNAEVIMAPINIDRVQLGSTVVVEIADKQKTYTILGASEADPTAGIISHESPLGLALMGKSSGDYATIPTTGKTLQIVRIS